LKWLSNPEAEAKYLRGFLNQQKGQNQQGPSTLTGPASASLEGPGEPSIAIVNLKTQKKITSKKQEE
jgi:hypothetical protein